MARTRTPPAPSSPGVGPNAATTSNPNFLCRISPPGGDNWEMDVPDHELLRRYAREGSEPAFRELVERHVNLVYAVAWRHLHSHSLAADVAQSVFIDLARSANALPPAQPLVAWLHVVARRTAIDVVRSEQRRLAREYAAAELAAMNTSPEWNAIEPLLDEALDTLDESDRHALLLRFFENCSLREVGAALGISEDGAQKRVSRALEELRTVFARRGIVLTGAGLTAGLGAHAAGPGVAGLAALIATQALPHAVPAASALTLTMVTKSLLAASLVLAASFAYQGHALAEGREKIDLMARRLAADRLASQQLRIQDERAAHDLAAARQRIELTRSRIESDAKTEAALEEWLGRVTQLKEWFAANPGQNIPEMRYLKSSDWLTATLDQHLKTPTDIRYASANLRQMAKSRPEISGNLSHALRQYFRAHNNTAATTMADLQPYLNPPLSDDILERYAFHPTDAADWTGGRVVLQERNLPDEDFDRQFFFSETGSSGSRSSATVAALGEAHRAFRAANPNQTIKQLEQILPYLPPSANVTKVRAYWEATHP